LVYVLTDVTQKAVNFTSTVWLHVPYYC